KIDLDHFSRIVETICNPVSALTDYVYSAILRESFDEISIDHVFDPISDSNFLHISAGKLSFD
ncbi:hypothetical protein MKX01_017549, partial [Papaver californicum]